MIYFSIVYIFSHSYSESSYHRDLCDRSWQCGEVAYITTYVRPLQSLQRRAVSCPTCAQPANCLRQQNMSVWALICRTLHSCLTLSMPCARSVAVRDRLFNRSSPSFGSAVADHFTSRDSPRDKLLNCKSMSVSSLSLLEIGASVLDLFNYLISFSWWRGHAS